MLHYRKVSARFGGDRSYWERLAACYWAVGAPLRPAPEDIGRLEETAARLTNGAEAEPLQAVLLGVTPAIATMRWPGRTRLLAVDGAFAMIRALWPGDVAGVRRAVCAEWLHLPVADGSEDLICGDGSANCVPYAEGLRGLAREAARALREEGYLVLRCYAQPEVREDAAQVMESLRTGGNASFHHFKLRLLMAMQESPRKGVAVADVYRYWEQSGASVEDAARITGWDEEEIRTIEAYRDSSTVHFFPTLEEFRGVLAEDFTELSCTTSAYPLAERCPLLVLRRRQQRTTGWR